MDEDMGMKKHSINDREGNKILYQTSKKIKQEVADYLMNETSFKDDDVIILVQYVGIISEAICICQALSEVILIPFIISTATSDTFEIMFESLWSISWQSISACINHQQNIKFTIGVLYAKRL